MKILACDKKIKSTKVFTEYPTRRSITKFTQFIFFFHAETLQKTVEVLPEAPAK